MIISAYQQLQKVIAEESELFEKKMRFSDTFRKIACYVLLFAAIVGGCYALILKTKWYFVLLFILAAFLVAVLLCGTVIFLFKPIFYFYRRRVKVLHQKISAKETDRQTLESLLLINNTPEPLPIEREPLYLKNSNRIRLKTVFAKYHTIISEQMEAEQHLRVCRIEHQKNREWLWFGFALLLLGLAASVILAMIALYFLFIFIGLVILIAMVVGWIAGQREYLPPVRKADPYYDPHPQRPSLFERFFDITVDAIFANDDASKAALDQARTNYTRLTAEKEEYLQLLLPYCPILGELHPQPTQTPSLPEPK